MFAASKTGRAVAGAVTDPYFPYVPLLLETGASSTRSTTVLDGAATPNTVTRNGTPSTGWTSPYQTTGYWSGYFKGSSDYLTTPNSSGGALELAQQTVFTVECWVYPTSYNSSQATIAGTRNNLSGGWELRLNTSGTAQFYKTGVGTSITSTATVPLNQWTYIAVTQNGSALALYVNSTSASNSTGTTGTVGTGSLGIGSDSVSTDAFAGYISNLKISNVVRTISVPTAPLSSDANTVLLCLQSNRFIDNSSSARVLTVNGSPQTTPYYYPSGFTAPTASPGAGYFDGSNSNYLSLTNSSALQLTNATAFTIECWVYLFSTTGSPIVINSYNPSSPYQGYGLRVNSTGGNFEFWDGTNWNSFGYVAQTNVWTHVAVSYEGSGTTRRLFINGVLQGSAGTVPSSINYTSGTVALGSFGGANSCNGYISNLRIVKGTAVYTGAFTPPSNFVTQTGGTYPSTTNVNTSIPSANTSLLLNLADSNYTSATNGVQNNTFIDSSNYAFPITRNGTPTQGAFTPYQPSGYWSGIFNGTSDYLTVASSANLTIGTNSATVEFWVYPTAVDSFRRIVTSTTGTFNTGSFVMRFNNGTFLAGSGGNSITSSTIPAINTWSHVAWVGTSGTSQTLYINGVSAGTAGSYNLTEAIRFFGGYFGSTEFYSGYLANLRIVNGTAIYTGAFTPPTTPLTAITNTSLLTLQDNRFKDNSSNAFAITVNGTPKVQAFQPFAPAASYSAATYGGSGWLPGSSSDYLSVADNTAFNFTTGSWTIEAWAYPTARSATYGSTIVSKRNPGSPFTWAWDLAINPSGYPAVLSASITSSILAPLNTWTHIAAVSNGSTITLYVNGVAAAGPTAYTVPSTTGSVYIGNYPTDNPFFTGYLSNIRIVKGTAVYTGAFTPPTLAPLTTAGSTSAASYPSTTNVNTSFAASNTSLLTNFTNAGIYDAAWQNNALTVGDAQASTTQYKWSPTSMKFDGTGDYLTMPSNQGVALGTGDWTIECWVYLSSVTAQQIFLDTRATNTDNGYAFYMTAGSKLSLFTSNTAVLTSTSSLSANAWVYIAMTRTSGTVRAYINGTLDATTASYSTAMNCPGSILVGGGLGAVNLVNGYIQDLRITKGVARTITTPTAAFPTR